MIGGFALIAYPAEYGKSGVMSFVVNQDGTVLQKDLGPTTAKRARAIEAYAPDQSWTKSTRRHKAKCPSHSGRPKHRPGTERLIN
jgi:hypothetical protein